jgi:hypothetical protein
MKLVKYLHYTRFINTDRIKIQGMLSALFIKLQISEHSTKLHRKVYGNVSINQEDNLVLGQFYDLITKQ